MWTDGHLDLAYMAVTGRDLRRACPPGGDACVGLPDLRAAGVDLVFATIFTEADGDDAAAYPAGDAAAADRAAMAQMAVYDELRREGRLELVRDRRTVTEEAPAAPLRAVLLMEGADPIQGPDDVRRWFDLGVRLVGLTWARGSRYAGGNATGGPLTPAGRDLVAALDAAGIIHDASHLSRAALDDLLALTRGPIVATHSNAAHLVGPDDRHLTDEHLRAIADRDGIVGLNLYGAFLARGRRATVDDGIAHVEHVAATMGHRRGVALGSDMDGGFPPSALPEGLDHPSRLPALADGLARRGWSEEDVEGFRAGNWRRFLARALPA